MYRGCVDKKIRNSGRNWILWWLDLAFLVNTKRIVRLVENLFKAVDWEVGTLDRSLHSHFMHERS